MKYFGDAFRLEHAANLFSKLVEREPEVAALLAQSFFGMSTFRPRTSTPLTLRRRRSESDPNPLHRAAPEPPIIRPLARSSRLSQEQGPHRMGAQARETGRQLRPERVCDVGKADRSVYRSRGI